VLGGRSFHADVSAKVKVARASSQGAAASRPLPDGVVGFPLPGLARLR
jgi:hypothetical protein